MLAPYDGDLDILGQQPGLKIYTQIVSCYPVPKTRSDSEIIETLKNGIERLSASFPWVAGQVVNEGAKEGDSGSFKIVPRPEKGLTLVVKDVRDDHSFPTMDDLRRSNFPMNALHEDFVAPRTTLPHPGDDDKGWPVFVAQATFVKGGLLLTFVGEHHTMDMTGQARLMSLFSQACRGEPFTSEQILSGNIPRRNIIPPLDESFDPNEGSELARQMVKPAPPTEKADAPPSQPLRSSWASFSFSSASLIELKSSAARSLTTRFVSTDDTLSAFIWQSITRARLPRLKMTASKDVVFARAVDMRPFLDVPATYTGLCQNMAYSSMEPSKIVEQPLGYTASALRQALNPQQLAHNTRALATLFERSPDKNVANFTASLDLSMDIMLSSWAKFDIYDLDFGLGLGKPVAVRRPSFDPVESLLYLCPKAPDGEINAAICLRDEDMERLKADQEFKRYAVYVG